MVFIELPYGWEKVDDRQCGTYYIEYVSFPSFSHHKLKILFLPRRANLPTTVGIALWPTTEATTLNVKLKCLLGKLIGGSQVYYSN